VPDSLPKMPASVPTAERNSHGRTVRESSREAGLADELIGAADGEVDCAVICDGHRKMKTKIVMKADALPKRDALAGDLASPRARWCE